MPAAQRMIFILIIYFLRETRRGFHYLFSINFIISMTRNDDSGATHPFGCVDVLDLAYLWYRGSLSTRNTYVTNPLILLFWEGEVVQQRLINSLFYQITATSNYRRRYHHRCIACFSLQLLGCFLVFPGLGLGQSACVASLQRPVSSLFYFAFLYRRWLIAVLLIVLLFLF